MTTTIIENARFSLSQYSLSFTEREAILGDLQKITQVKKKVLLEIRELLKLQDVRFLYTRADRIDSQGLSVSSDESYALSHQSTIPSNYYKNKYGTLGDQFIKAYRVPAEVRTLENLNMDRGWVGELGSMRAACIADGVSGNGIRSMHVAQICMNSVFQYFMIHGSFHLRSGDGGSSAANGIQVFKEVQKIVSDDDDYLMGATTCAFATITQESGELFVEGAAIGDSAIVHLDVRREVATRLNLIAREEGNRSNTGGQIVGGSRELHDQEVVGFIVQVDPNDLVILASDGLIDNLVSTSAIPPIIKNPQFDVVPNEVWENNELPSVDHLSRMIERADSLVVLTALVAIRRLNNYAHWVTARRMEIEQAWYADHNAEELFPVDYKGMRAKTDDVIIAVMSASIG